MAVEQGVVGVALEGWTKLPQDEWPPKKLKIQWGLTVKSREEVYQQQLETARQLSDAFHDAGIRTMVLKGIGLSTYYPNPTHRECNDIDLYLYGKHEQGNAIAASLGAKVSAFNKKHDHILLNGFNIDNHIDFMQVNTRKKRALNDALLALADTAEVQYIGNTHLILPPRDFNYVFLLRHAYGHFLIEGIALRHLLDIYVFLEHEGSALDWHTINKVLDAGGLRKFSDTVLRLLDVYFGSSFSDGKHLSRGLLKRIEWDMLHEQHQVVYGKTLRQRIAVTWHNRWKYKAFHEGGLCGFLAERFLHTKV